MSNIIDFLNILVQLILVVLPTIFVFAVSLLGDAFKRSEEEQRDTEQDRISEFNNKINDLRKASAGLNENTDDIKLRDLAKQIENLRRKRASAENQKNKITQKYNSLRLKDGVVIPAILMILILATNKFVIVYVENLKIILLLISINFFFLSEVLRRIYTTLSTIETIAVEIDDRKNKTTRELFTQIYTALDESKRPKPKLSFFDYKKNKFQFKVNEEYTVKYRIDLPSSGPETAKNVRVVFHLSPELEVVKNTDTQSISKELQESGWLIPRATTVDMSLLNLRKNQFLEASLCIKSLTSGTFKLVYSVDGDNFSDPVSSIHTIEVLG